MDNAVCEDLSTWTVKTINIYVVYKVFQQVLTGIVVFIFLYLTITIHRPKDAVRRKHITTSILFFYGELRCEEPGTEDTEVIEPLAEFYIFTIPFGNLH